MNAAVRTTPRCWKSRKRPVRRRLGERGREVDPGTGLALLRVDVEVAEVAGADRDEVAEGAEVGLEVGDRLAVELDARGEHGAAPGAVSPSRVTVYVPSSVSTVAVRLSSGRRLGAEVAGDRRGRRRA